MKKTGYDQFFKAAQKARVPVKTKKRSKPFPAGPFFTGMALIAIGLGYVAKPDVFWKVFSGKEFRFDSLDELEAEENPNAKAKAATAKDTDAAKAAAGAKTPDSADTSTKDRTVSRRHELYRQVACSQRGTRFARERVEPVGRRIAKTKSRGGPTYSPARTNAARYSEPIERANGYG